MSQEVLNKIQEIRNLLDELEVLVGVPPITPTPSPSPTPEVEGYAYWEDLTDIEVGGGETWYTKNNPMSGGVVVTNKNDFLNEIDIPGNIVEVQGEINLDGESAIDVEDNVVIYGNHRDGGALSKLYWENHVIQGSFSNKAMFNVKGNNVKFIGLHIQGKSFNTLDKDDANSRACFIRGENIQFINCEISDFERNGIDIQDSVTTSLIHCYLHQFSLYPVFVAKDSSHVIVEGSLIDFPWHAVATNKSKSDHDWKVRGCLLRKLRRPVDVWDEFQWGGKIFLDVHAPDGGGDFESKYNTFQIIDVHPDDPWHPDDYYDIYIREDSGADTFNSLTLQGNEYSSSRSDIVRVDSIGEIINL